MYQIEVKRYLIEHLFPSKDGWKVSLDIDAMEKGKGNQGDEKQAVAAECINWFRDQKHVTIGSHPIYGRSDMVAEREGGVTYILEVEGDSTRQCEQALYSALGQITLLISENFDMVRYGLAVPDSHLWQVQVQKIPEYVRSVLNLRLYFVSESGVRQLEFKNNAIDIDSMEMKLGHMLRRDFNDEIVLFEKSLNFIMRCVNEFQLGEAEQFNRVLTAEYGSLDEKMEDWLKQFFVCSTLLGEATVRLQAARRLFLSGYPSRTLASLRDAFEAIKWSDICLKDIGQVDIWLKGKKIKTNKNIKLQPMFQRWDALLSDTYNPLGTHSYVGAVLKSSMPQTQYLKKILRLDERDEREYKESVVLVVVHMLLINCLFLEYISECYPKVTTHVSELKSTISELNESILKHKGQMDATYKGSS